MESGGRDEVLILVQEGFFIESVDVDARGVTGRWAGTEGVAGLAEVVW